MTKQSIGLEDNILRFNESIESTIDALVEFCS